MTSNAQRTVALILGSVVLCAALAFGFSTTRTKVAPVRAQIVVSDFRSPTLTTTNLTQARNRVADEVLRAGSREVLAAAADDLGIELPALRRSVRITQDEDATAIVIDGRAQTGGVSRDRANAVVDAYEAVVRADFEEDTAALLAEVDRLVGSGEDRLIGIDAEIEVIDAELRAEAQASTDNATAAETLLRNLTTNSFDRTALSRERTDIANGVERLRDRRGEIEAERNLFEGGIAFTRRADELSGPIEPQTGRNVALAAALGVLIGIGIAWSVSDAAADERDQRT